MSNREKLGLGELYRQFKKLPIIKLARKIDEKIDELNGGGKKLLLVQLNLLPEIALVRGMHLHLRPESGSDEKIFSLGYRPSDTSFRMYDDQIDYLCNSMDVTIMLSDRQEEYWAGYLDYLKIRDRDPTKIIRSRNTYWSDNLKGVGGLNRTVGFLELICLHDCVRLNEVTGQRYTPTFNSKEFDKLMSQYLADKPVGGRGFVTEWLRAFLESKNKGFVHLTSLPLEYKPNGNGGSYPVTHAPNTYVAAEAIKGFRFL